MKMKEIGPTGGGGQVVKNSLRILYDNHVKYIPLNSNHLRDAETCILTFMRFAGLQVYGLGIIGD